MMTNEVKAFHKPSISCLPLPQGEIEIKKCAIIGREEGCKSSKNKVWRAGKIIIPQFLVFAGIDIVTTIEK